MTEERKSFSCAGCAHWGLIGSIAVNLFLIGVIVGPLLGRGPMPDNGPRPLGPPRGPEFVFDRIARDLPAPEAQKLRAIFDEERETLHRQHESMREMMPRVAEIMKAEKPDLAQLHKTLEDIGANGQRLHQGMARALERTVTELSADSRRKIAQRMLEMRPPEDERPDGPRGHEHRQPEPMPPEGGPVPPRE